MFHLSKKEIFKELCKKEDYKNDPICKICKLKFGVFTFSKNCKFCGNSVCAEELVKERADPQNPKSFHPICKICERLYIEKHIYDENVKKRKTQALEIELLTKRLAEIEIILKKKKSDFEEIKFEADSKRTVFEEKIKKLKKEIYSLDRSIDKHTIDKMTLIENISNLELMMEKTKGKIASTENECQRLKEEEIDLIQKNKARDTDIRQTVAQNKDLERKLANLSIDSIYSSVLVESYPTKGDEKSVAKTSADDYRRTGASEEEPLLIQERQSYCCKRCGIF